MVKNLKNKTLSVVLATALFYSFMVFLSGCEQTTIETNNNPVVIPTSEFVLEDCSWTNITSDTVNIINSTDELANYVNCENDLPDINFSTQTLLVVRGGATNGIQSITSELTKNEGQYTLNIDILLDDTFVAPGWLVALLSNKLATDNIKLNVVSHH